ncbi:hypothetical protein STSP2_02050 [Anaerohalosphaera lusitana]|uniref:Flippase-like domain-containing protein n=1 Tax=Anaerohalosphaera lusitana TaxID=1936003 RepID=A0A1U9NMB4_9BACT|nr:lysylphosphatidylglycerol synthase transmembrane domain-containing protein [Anaerohalosphaera lusitana]AQT68874.1 hypothetical protein STSP2_02050 [Anaerohalosphaera lusitana]
MSPAWTSTHKQFMTVSIRVLIAAGALYLVFKGEDLTELGDVMLGLNKLVFAGALGLYLAGQAVFVLRWRLISSVQSVHFGFFAGLKLHFLGLFYNNCLPSAVGGDLLRAWYVTKHCDPDRKVEAVLSVAVDRAVGLIGMILMAATFYFLWPVETADAQTAPVTAGEGGGQLVGFLKFGGVLFLCVLFALAVLTASKKGRNWLVSLVSRVEHLFIHVVKTFVTAVGLYSRRMHVILLGIVLTFFSQGLCILGFWLCGRNLGLDVNVKYYYVLFPVSWMIGSLPISIGGVGLMEGWLKIAFTKLSGGQSVLAAAVAICQRLIWLIGSIPGLLIHIFGAHLPTHKEEIFIDSAEEID